MCRICASRKRYLGFWAIGLFDTEVEVVEMWESLAARVQKCGTERLRRRAQKPVSGAGELKDGDLLSKMKVQERGTGNGEQGIGDNGYF